MNTELERLRDKKRLKLGSASGSNLQGLLDIKQRISLRHFAFEAKGQHHYRNVEKKL